MTVAIIGTGWGARVQVPAFRAAGLEVVALAGSQQAKTERIAADLAIGSATTDWRTLLTRSDVQLISIVTPPDLHAEMAIAALEANKHVLCEKPTALNSAEAEQMLAASESRPGLLALIDHELRFLPALIHARKLIAAGAIGPVRYILSQVLNGSRGPQREWSWWNDAARGGGMLGAVGSHQIDTLRYLLGFEVASLAATLATLISERPGPAGPTLVTSDDSYSLRLRFPGGAIASLEGSLALPLSDPDRLTIYGETGALRWSGGQLLHATPGQALRDITPAHSYDPPPGQRGDFPYATLYMAHALRAFLEGDPDAVAPGATFSDGLRIQRTLDAARRSAADGSYAAVEA